jgi:hypothetical protein
VVVAQSVGDEPVIMRWANIYIRQIAVAGVNAPRTPTIVIQMAHRTSNGLYHQKKYITPCNDANASVTKVKLRRGSVAHVMHD